MSWYTTPYYHEDGWTPPSTTSLPYFQMALVLSTIVFLFETYLDYRQHQKLHETQFPSSLATAIQNLGTYTPSSTDDNKDEAKTTEKISLLKATLDKFDKSRAYGIDKSSFGFLSGAYTQLESTAFLLLGYLPFMWTISGRVLTWLGADPHHEIYRTLVLLTLTTLRDTIFGLPFSLYSTFVIEQKHGFNQQTLGLFFMDKLKGLFLMVVIGFPVVSILILLIQWGGSSFYLYVWFFLFLFSILMVTIYPIWIMPLFNTFTPLEQGPLRIRIEKLASSLSFPLTQLFVVDGSKRSNHSNAYFFGLFNSKRIVLFDTLLKQATEDEIVAILGHELGHWKCWHTIQGFVIQQIYTLCLFYVFGRCLNDSDLLSSFGFYTSASSPPVIIVFILFSSTIWYPIDHLLSFLLTLNTRRNEFQADAFAVDLGFSQALQSGLTKLAIENLSNMNPDHLYSAYHYSHPPLLERLQAITTREKKKQE